MSAIAPPLADSVPSAAAAAQESAPAALSPGQLALILKSLFAQVPAVKNPFAGLTVATVPGQVKLEFTKLIDVRAFKRPASANEALARLRANVKFFKLTYSFVALVIVAVYVLSNLSLFIAVASLLALWSWFLNQPADAVTTVAGMQIKRSEKLIVLVVASVVMVLFGGLFSAVFYCGLETLVVVGAHGAMREAVELDALEELQLENEKLVSASGPNMV